MRQLNSSFIIPGAVGALEVSGVDGDSAGPLFVRNLTVVICHPHPVHGGTMDNKVVTTLARTYRDLGIRALRFNFRGVGASEGQFDHGAGELDDLLAVVAWVAKEHPTTGLMLAGFSFGSSMAAQASYRLKHLHHLLLVAPPVERYPYDQGGVFPAPLCVVQGDKDERVLAEGVYTWVKNLHSPVELLRYSEAGHFFHGYLAQLKTDLSLVVTRQLNV